MTIYDSYSASINSSPPHASEALSADQSCAKQLQRHLAKSCSDIGDIRYENVQTGDCTSKCAMEDVTQTRMEAPRVSPAELNGDVPSALINLVLPNDVKKRPLSISSTSSSNSSTSSLPRHQRKKVATTSCLATATATTTCVTTTRSGQSPLYGATVPMDTSAGLTVAPPGDSKDVLPRTSLSNLCDIVNKDVHKVKFTSESGRNVYIDRVVTEILDSERSYVRDLNDIIQGYLRHILETPELSIPEEDVVALFGNIEAIYHFSRGFLECLEQCGHDAVSIASCFVDMTDGFDIYTQYCTNYPRSVVVLTQCVNDTRLAVMFKQRQGMLGHGLPLGAYLLKPIQRVLKYHLLLQKIVNNYDENETGYDVIAKALRSMTHMAAHINEMKRKHEHTMRVQEIQSVLHDWDGHDLMTYGDLILEDSFRMSGAKLNRQLFLFEKGLLVTKKREDGHLLVKAAIESSNLMLIESVPKEPLSFHVIPFNNPRVQYTVQARSLEQKRKWCREMKRLILENFQSVIPDKVKELVMQLGKSREEEDLDGSLCESREQAPRQHSAPEYLEKRRAGRRKSTSTILDFGLLKSRLAARRSPPLRRRSDITPPNLASRNKSRLSDTAEETGGILEEQPSLQSIDDSSTECSGTNTSTHDSDTPRNHSNNSLTLEADSEDSASESETVSPVWRRESFKKATDSFNRIDSQMKTRCRRNATVQRPEQLMRGLEESCDPSQTRHSGKEDSEHSSGSHIDTLSPREGVDISNSPTTNSSEGGCDRNQHKTPPSSSPLDTQSSHVLATSCSSPVLLSRSARQGSDPWVLMTEPVYCRQHRAERACSPCRSSVSPSRDFGSGLLFRANSCSSLSDCLEDAALYGQCHCPPVISVLGSPRVSRLDTEVSPRHSASVERQDASTGHGGCVTPKSDTSPECDRELCGFCADNPKTALKGAPPVRCTCSERKSAAMGAPSPGSSPQGEGYTPKYVSPNMKRFSSCRSSSFSDATHHAVKAPLAPSLSSPCSTTSTDSLVESLRNAVGNLRSRLTRRQPAAHSHMTRARSASAIDRISQRSPPRETKEKGRRRQSKLVQQLKRTYSDRERRRNRFGGSAVIIPVTDHRPADTSKELMSLLKGTTQGSPAIGARYATARPCSLANHTLPRRVQPSFTCPTDKTDGGTEAGVTHTSQPSPEVTVVATRAMSDTKDGRRLAYDSGCVDTDILCTSQKDIRGDAPEVIIDDFSDETFRQLEIGSRKTLDSVDTISNTASIDSYYERRFAEELEMDATSHHSDEGVFRDSAVYSDDGILICAVDIPLTDTVDVPVTDGSDIPVTDNSADKDNSTTSVDDVGVTTNDSADNVSDIGTEHDTSASVSDNTADISDIAQSKPPVISDAVKLIHEKYNSVSASQVKTRQKLITKAPAFQEIMRNLEAGNNTEQPESPSPDVDTGVSPLKTSTPSVSRELVHCASLARMRQDSASISDKHFTEEWPPRQRVKGQDSDASPTPVDMTPVPLESIPKAPLSPMSPTQFPWSPTPLAKKKVGWPWSPTAIPKVTSPGADRAKVMRSPSPRSRDRTQMMESPIIKDPELTKDPEPAKDPELTKGPHSAKEPCSATEEQLTVPCGKTTLTVDVHKMSASPEEDATFGHLHAEWPPSGSDEQPKSPMSPARRGWVKFMVKQLQGDEVAS